MSRILVFDSGVGGLSIVQTLQEQAPSHVCIDYAADAGFFPYGTKTDDELKDRLPRLCAALYETAKPDVIVIACNTASTLALDAIRAALPIPVVGTVPAIKPAASLTKTGVVGVLATPGTVRRQYLDDLEQEFAKDVTVLRHGTSGLVELAERAVRGDRIDQRAVEQCVAPLFDLKRGADIDVVILACTHFPLIKKHIKNALPEHVLKIIDTGEAIARQALRVLPGENAISNSPEPCVLLTGGRANRLAYAPALSQFGYNMVNTIDV
jgi:glutamate racemase